MKLLTEFESGEYIAKVLKLKGTLTILISLIGSLRRHYSAQMWTITYVESYFKVSFYIPFFMASRSFALSGTFST